MLNQHLVSEMVVGRVVVIAVGCDGVVWLGVMVMWWLVDVEG